MSNHEIDIFGTIFDSQKLSDEYCFLCGENLSAGGTQEHVFPKWLQRKHNLWNESLVLLNHTSIKYSQLKVPCCGECNNTHLGSLENRVRSAVEKGYEASSLLPNLVIYQWIGKIFYGILRKELGLLLDRRAVDKGTIVQKELMESFSSLHIFLQSIRRPLEFLGDLPFSVLTLNLYYQEGESSFNFQDSLKGMICSLRTNDVGFIVALEDMGIIGASYGRYVQFDELYAKCLYQVSLINHTPNFITSTNVEDPSVPSTVAMFSNRPRNINAWEQSMFAEYLFNILSKSYEIVFDEIFFPPDQVATWMSDPQGRLLLVDEDGNPLPLNP